MLENCIRCTICVENCPVFAVNPRFPGPKQSGPDAQRFRLDGEAVVDTWVKYCSQCRRCQIACPYGVDCADIILQAQMKHREFKSLPRRLFARITILGRMASCFPPLVNYLMRRKWVQKFLRRSGVSTLVPTPPYRFRTLERSWRHPGLLGGGREKKIALFYGCFLNYNRPDIGRTIRDILLFLGFQVTLPPQTCCGLPALGNYDERLMHRYAQKNVTALIPYIDAGYDIVYACTSCGLMLTHDYHRLLNIPGGKKIAENTYYLYEYLLNHIGEKVLSTLWGEVNRNVAYHVPCHLKALGMGYPVMEIFAHIPFLVTHVLDEHCCGLAGSYGFKVENEVTTEEVGKLAAGAVTRSGANTIISDCGACRMQLGYVTGLPALDPIEILSEALTSKGIKLSIMNLFLGGREVFPGVAP